MKKNTILVTVSLMVSNIIVKFLGLLREVILANTYGTSKISDAYIVANNIPIVIFSVVSVAISTCFIPIYCEVKEKNGENQAIKFMSNFVNILLIIALFLTVLGEFFPQVLVKIFAYGFEAEQYKLAINFTRILLPSIIIIALMGISGSYLQIKNDFLPMSYVTIPNNLIVIVSILISFYTGKVYILAIGTLIGSISQFVYYYPFLKKNNYRHIWYLNIKDRNISKVLVMVMPVFISAAITQINTIIDRSLVSGLEVGSIAALNYSSKLIGFVTGVFIASLMTIIYPKMSELIAKDDKVKFEKYVIDSLNVMTIILIPIIIITFISANDIVRIIFERGSFTSESTYMTANALSAYSIGIIGMGYRDILSKAFFSLKDSKTPMINGIIAVLLNIGLNILFIKKIGFVGSAISTSIASIVTSILLLFSLKKYVENITNSELILNLFKIIISGILSVVPIIFIFINIIKYKHINSLLDIVILGIGTLISCIAYFIVLLIFKEKQAIKIYESIKFKVKKYI